MHDSNHLKDLFLFLRLLDSYIYAFSVWIVSDEKLVLIDQTIIIIVLWPNRPKLCSLLCSSLHTFCTAMHCTQVRFKEAFSFHSKSGKGPLISLCRIISEECPTNLNFPLLTSNQNKRSPKQPISMKGRSKFFGHSTEIILQSKIKGPLSKLTVSQA